MKTKTIYSIMLLLVFLQITQARNFNYLKKYNPKEVANSQSKKQSNSSIFTSTDVKTYENVYIPDANFEQALINSGYDDVLDNYFKAENVINVTSLSLNGKQITDLTGIEAFLGLIDLDISNNKLNYLNISNLTNLVTINLRANNIGGTIDFSANSKLESINAGYNKLETLDLSKNIELITLDLSFNQFSTIDLSYNLKLNYLNLAHRSRNISGNGGSSEITFSNLRSIDVSNNTLLQYLNLDNNLISTIDLSQNINLTELYISENNLTSIDVSNNLMLNTLRLSDNNLTSLNVNMLESLISFSSKGNNLYCISVFNVEFANQNWRTFADASTLFLNNCDDLVYVPDDNFEQTLIDLGYDDVLDDYINKQDIINVTLLDVSGKQIDDLTGIEAFTALENLNASNNNGLDDLNITTLTNLKILNIENDLIRGTIDISKNAALEELYAGTNDFKSLDVTQNINLKKLDLIYNKLTEIDLSNNIQLTYLNFTNGSSLANSKLTTIDISKNTLLQELYLQGNLLSTIDVSKNINLTKLLIPNNNLSSIDVSNNLMLNTLGVSNNNLSSLNISMLESLLFFSSKGNNLHCVSVFDVDFANQNWKTNSDENTIFSTNCDDLVYVPDNNFEQALIDLGYDTVLDDYVNKQNILNVTSLDVSNKQITDLTGIEAFTALENLNASNNNGLDDLNITTLTNLKILNIENDLILGTIDISKNAALEELYAGTNDFKSLDVTQNINLKKLDLIYNKLTEIDLSNNIQLTYLNFTNGSSLANSKLTTIDISKNTLLQELYLQGNLLSTIDVSKNINLTKLLIPSNNLSSIDVSNNLMLNTLGVSNNNLTSLDIRLLTNLLFFSASGNSNLHCISVNDVNFATQNWSQNVDDNVIFDLDCNLWTYVPDDNFEQALIDLGYDLLLDNFISSNIAASVSTLNIFEKQISDLTGIEGFTNLKELNCAKNNLTNLDLTNNTKLEKLVISENNIYYIDVSKNTELNTLVISSSSISFIDVTKNLKLKSFAAFSTQLNYVDFAFNKDLEILQLDNNHISTINLENNNNLKVLDLGRNNLMSINLTKNLKLEALDLESNNLSVLDIKNNFRLTTFNARINNNLTCINTWDVNYANQNWSQNIDATASFGDNCYTNIPDDNFESALISMGYDNQIDDYVLTSNISNIQSLNLDSKYISDATGIENFISLKDLYLKGNQLTTIDLKQNTQLLNLNISNNLLDRLDISQNTLLENFEAINNKLTCIKVWDENYAINSWTNKVDSNVGFSLDCDDVWTIEVDEELKSLITIVIGLDKDNDGEITLAEAKEFTGELDLSGKNLDDIKGLEAFINLTTLNLSNNNINDLSQLTGKKITLISKTTGAKRVVETNELTIENLIISNNSFETLNLDNLTNLKTLDVSNNINLTTMSIKNGKNEDLNNFNSTNTPNLSCILVDDSNADYLLNWVKDSKNKFVENETQCRESVLNVDTFNEKDLTIFPNPVSNILTINSTKLIDKIEVYTTLGKKVITKNETIIDFSNYPTGIYILKIISNNMVVTRRILKQ